MTCGGLLVAAPVALLVAGPDQSTTEDPGGIYTGENDEGGTRRSGGTALTSAVQLPPVQPPPAVAVPPADAGGADPAGTAGGGSTGGGAAGGGAAGGGSAGGGSAGGGSGGGWSGGGGTGAGGQPDTAAGSDGSTQQQPQPQQAPQPATPQQPTQQEEEQPPATDAQGRPCPCQYVGGVLTSVQAINPVPAPGALPGLPPVG